MSSRTDADVNSRAFVVVAVAVIAVVISLTGCTRGNKPQTSAAPSTTEPISGEYTVNFGPLVDIPTGRQIEPATGAGAFEMRSLCRSADCVATANVKSGPTLKQLYAFDRIGTHWMAVEVTPSSPTSQNIPNCRGGAPGEIWETINIEPKPDGTLAGEYTVISSNNCNFVRNVTFTRVGNTDVGRVPDPALLVPRVESVAQALRGRYRFTNVFAGGNPSPATELLAYTTCLRTGESCMSFLHSADAGRSAVPLVFGGARWTWSEEDDYSCRNDGTMQHTKVAAEFPLPAPQQNPITLLAGRGRLEAPEPCQAGDFDATFERTGD